MNSVVFSIMLQPEPIISFSMDNIFNAGGFILAINGMMTVFIGLIVIWGIVNLNRVIVHRLQHKRTRKKEVNEPDKSLSPMSMINDDNLEQIAVMIATTYAYSEAFEDDHMEILNLKHFEQEISPWVVVAREQMMRNY